MNVEQPGIEYLGDWHTHPGGRARPSHLDKKTLGDIAAFDAARQPNPVMLIVALNEDGTAAPAAIEHGARARVHSLRVAVVEDL